jgi:diguanylate cyclase (GGDEF)-like protein/PAS domain S-box-containing protein
MKDADICLVLWQQWQITAVSAGVTTLLGHDPQDFLANRISLRDQIHPHDSDIAEQIFSHDLQVGCGVFRLRLRHADGRIRCVRTESTKEANSNGQVLLRLTLQDSKSLPLEMADPRSSLNLRSVMESVNECVYFKNRDHVITEANMKSRRLFSAPAGQPREIVGLTDYDLLHETRADASYNTEKQIFAGLPMGHEVLESVDETGGKSWTDIRKFPVKDDGGQIIGLFTIARDITDRMLAEQALRESEESLKEAQKIAGLGSYVSRLDVDEWRSSEVLDTILGFENKDVHTLADWRAVVHPDDRAMMDAYFVDEVLGNGRRFDKEYRIIRPKDGEERWVHGLGRLEFDSDGRPVVMRGTIQDITERKRAEAALRESKELLLLFIQHAPAALAMFDCEMRYLAVSRRWLEDFGLNGRKIIGQSHYDIIPEIPEQWRKAHQRALNGETVRTSEDLLERADGTSQWVRREVRPWRTGDGAVGGIIIFAEDITRRKQVEDRLHLAASVFTHAAEGITITDSEGNIIEVNDAFTRITGYSRDEVLGKNPRILKSGRQSDEFYEEMWRALKEWGHWSGEIWNRAKDGRVFAEMLTISALRDTSGKVERYVALFSDVTPMKDQQRKLEHAAHYDLLTGLPNRTLLAEQLQREMTEARRRGQSVAVVCLDLDDFKAVNETQGQNFGDQLLTIVANRLQSALREGDTLARLGGDEFAVILTASSGGSEHDDALNRLLKAAAEPVRLGNATIQMSASAGVTFYPQSDEVNADQLLRQADQAMYQAKLEGKNRFYIFDPRADQTARGHHEELERIRQALATGEFVLHYQPKVNLCTGNVLGAEALIRWQHPERGLLSPVQFLPAVEGHPLAIELGEWVIGSALTQMERWQADGLQIPVSVNVGAEQLQQPDFVDRLRALLDAHPAVSPSQLELEVLESTALKDVEQVAELMTACSALGVYFALDDFGTGYSSLTYLRRLPVKVLKIDQSFVHNMPDNPEDLSILEGVLGLATAFRCQVIAEGVESVEQGLMLLRLGCQTAQGYGIAKPMPADKLPGWQASWRPHARWANSYPFDPVDRPLLYAGVEHRAWTVGLEAYLLGKRHTAPAWEGSPCRFQAWLHGDGRSRHGVRTAFQRMNTVHESLHTLADEILTHNDEGRKQQALALVGELHSLHNSMQKALSSLMCTI